MPDPACNPYLAFALVCAAGLRGIEHGYELQPEYDGADRDSLARLPADLGEALDALEDSALARDVLGEQLFTWFVANKRREWAAYRSTVTDYERKSFPGPL